MGNVRRVILLEPSRTDVDASKAAQHGELVTLFAPVRRGREDGESAPRPHRPSVTNFEAYTQAVMRRLEEVEFDAEHDALVLTGASLALCLAFSGIALVYRRFMVLAYVAQLDAYVLKEYSAQWAEGSSTTTTGATTR